MIDYSHNNSASAQLMLESQLAAYIERTEALKWAFELVFNEMRVGEDAVRFSVFCATIMDNIETNTRHLAESMDDFQRARRAEA